MVRICKLFLAHQIKKYDADICIFVRMSRTIELINPPKYIIDQISFKANVLLPQMKASGKGY